MRPPPAVRGRRRPRGLQPRTRPEVTLWGRAHRDPPPAVPGAPAGVRAGRPPAHRSSAAGGREYAADAPSAAEVEAELYADTVRRLAGRPPVPVPVTESRHGLLLEQDGALYVCPLQPRLQVWAPAGRAGRRRRRCCPARPRCPPALREQAAADLAAFTRAGGDVRLFSRTAAWHVPVSWFVPFAGRRAHADRRRGALAALPDGDVVGPKACGSRASGRARRRWATSTSSTRSSRWPAGWRSSTRAAWSSWTTAGWRTCWTPSTCASDDSASDVAEGLAALSEGDATSAAAAYRRWTTRWQRVQLLSRAC